MNTGELLNELENAHYLGINSLCINCSCEFVATGGKDSKIKVWFLGDLLGQKAD